MKKFNFARFWNNTSTKIDSAATQTRITDAPRSSKETPEAKPKSVREENTPLWTEAKGKFGRVFKKGSARVFRFRNNERSKAVKIDTIADLRSFADKTPFAFLEEMMGQHPTLSLAISNINNSLWFPNSVKYEVYIDGKKDEALTKEAKNFLARQSKEIGNFRAFHESLTTELFGTGLVFTEVTAKEFEGDVPQGLDRIFPVPSKTILFKRNENDYLVPVQFQSLAAQDKLDAEKKTPSDVLTGNTGTNEVELNAEYCHWVTIGHRITDPHGVAPFAPAINEIIADFAMVRDLRDAIANGAYPRYKFDFDFAETFKVAREVFGIEDADEATQFVKARLAELQELAKDIPADGNVIGPIETLPAGDFQGLEAMLTFLRQRLAQACKTLPSILGIQEGTASSYSSVEWGIYVSCLESIRAIIAGLVVQILTHHLRLLGNANFEVIPHYAKLRTNEELTSENITEVKIRNLCAQVALGWITNEQACEEMRGHLPVGSPLEGMLESMFAKTSQGDKNQSGKSTKPNNDGTTGKQ